MTLVKHRIAVAERKVGGLPSNVALLSVEAVGLDAVLFTFAPFRILARGPRKGARRFLPGQRIQCVVTDAEAQAEQERFEIESGLCSQCGGDGREVCGWDSVSGRHYRTCQRCGGVRAHLAREQEPLGAEFEAVWDANRETLYEP
ncbi:MAG: hypothetical protein AB7U75_22055 [Hyphomicrobiaceae bacterium]